jgi:hypothetical protein
MRDSMGEVCLLTKDAKNTGVMKPVHELHEQRPLKWPRPANCGAGRRRRRFRPWKSRSFDSAGCKGRNLPRFRKKNLRLGMTDFECARS